MAEDFDNTVRRQHLVDAETFMADLAETIRSSAARAAAEGTDDGRAHWPRFVHGAVSALTATGQLTRERGRALELLALRPFIESGAIEPVSFTASQTESLASEYLRQDDERS